MNWIWLCYNAKLACVVGETFLKHMVTSSEKHAAGHVDSHQLCQECMAGARDTCHSLSASALSCLFSRTILALAPML